jgi:hypothetical protein
MSLNYSLLGFFTYTVSQGDVKFMPNPQSGRLKVTFCLVVKSPTCLAWMMLSEAYIVTSFAIQVIGTHRPPHHSKVVSQGEGTTE